MKLRHVVALQVVDIVRFIEVRLVLSIPRGLRQLDYRDVKRVIRVAAWRRLDILDAYRFRFLTTASTSGIVCVSGFSQ